MEQNGSGDKDLFYYRDKMYNIGRAHIIYSSYMCTQTCTATDKKKGTYLCNWTKSWRFATVLEGLFGESHSSSAALGSVQMSPSNHVVRDWSVPSVPVDV